MPLLFVIKQINDYKMATNEQIYTILTKKIVGTISTEEQKILDIWISYSEKNRKEFESYTELWKISEELIIARNIDVELSLKITKKKINQFRFKRRLVKLLRQVAAIIVLALAFNFAYNYLTKSPQSVIETEHIVYQEVKAAFGTQTKLTLADGTGVWLNSGSVLRFPASFNSFNERRVELDGEGYFEVSKNETKPFIVNASQLDVRVYGTSFNVSAYSDYNTTTVALVEGKVSLVKKYNGKDRELIILNPNDVVEYNLVENKMHHFSSQRMDKYIGWKDGYIIFYGDPIKNVIQKLEKWYNVDIVINDKSLNHYKFTATFVDESLEQVLNLLSLSSSMEYKIIPAKKQSDTTFSRRKVLLSIKK